MPWLREPAIVSMSVCGGSVFEGHRARLRAASSVPPPQPINVSNR